MSKYTEYVICSTYACTYASEYMRRRNEPLPGNLWASACWSPRDDTGRAGGQQLRLGLCALNSAARVSSRKRP